MWVWILLVVVVAGVGYKIMSDKKTTANKQIIAQV